MTTNHVLLLGNGINNIDNPYTWGNLVDDLIHFVGAADQIKRATKPFPLLYEEIVAYGIRQRHLDESEIKGYVADKIKRFQPNDIHCRIMGMRLKNILTTNYDYTLEMACGLKDSPVPVNVGIIKESVYSVFRHNDSKGTAIWHIHGERQARQSIALGYEHYSGYLQYMRDYVVKGTQQTYKKQLDSLEVQLAKGTVQFDSWVDFFFTRNIYILGLSLDFVEMHLWWLLTYRARRKYTKRTPVRNRIVYFYPDTQEAQICDRLDLFRASDVLLHPIPLKQNDWRAYYHKALDVVEGKKASPRGM